MEYQPMSKRPHVKAFLNANRSLPEGLGNLLLQELQDLSSENDEKFRYLSEEVLKKFVSDDTASPLVRRTAAHRKWLAAEAENEATNVRLLNTRGDFQILPHVQMEKFLDFLSQTVAGIIGDTVPVDALVGSFSGGASTSRKRTESHPARKYLGKAHVTKRALPYVEDLRELCPGWSQFWDNDGLTIVEVPGNVMFTVPKTTDIDRCACKEPDINMFLQKGAGLHIRRSLKRIGIDLNDQSRNRNLAAEGSRTGRLATIDLSSASDTITTEFVRLALPATWYTYLSDIRSEVTRIDGEEHVNQMFSSMGNGFTFELESLLFYALARTTAYFTGTRGVISVYGDDLIVPTQMYHDFTWVLSWFGFSVNPEKSFWDGPFRESCGGHFINGRDITPFYVKEPIKTLSDLIKFTNALRRWAEDDVVGMNDPRVFPLWEFAASFVPKRFWGASQHGTRYQLYAPGLPKSVLAPVKYRRIEDIGGYVHWLNSTDGRKTADEAVETSETSTEDSSGWMQIRRARKTVNLDLPHFPQEV